MPFLTTLVILLAASVLAVPLFNRLGLGSVLGYLAAGLVIGPAGLRLITDVDSIADVSALGVVMLLFLIGLELRPNRLWVMRHSVLGMGTVQLTISGVALAGLAHWAGLHWMPALIIGFGLALSSTAIALRLLRERGLLGSHAGRDSFAVLLFQDLAVIPMVTIIPLLQGGADELAGHGQDAWLAVSKAAAAVIAILVGGRFLIRPIFRAVASAKTPEIFTATALLLVVGTAALVSAVGLSMSLGAFMAGVLLADSEYRHELRANIEPFQGLLLGFFFVSVGMSVNIGVLLAHPGIVIAGVAVLLVVKGAIAFTAGRVAGQDTLNAMRLAFALAGAGEFGFVLFGVALDERVITQEQLDYVQLILTLSMTGGPLLFSLTERWIAPLFNRPPQRAFDKIPKTETAVIICGFGRIGQIVGRILRVRDIPFTALDNNAAQIEQVRQFGSKAYYGDPLRIDLLRAAGAADAKILVAALDDMQASLTLVQNVKRNFPHLIIVARARNRRHAHLLMDEGVTHIIRETLYSGLKMTEQVLEELGLSHHEAQRTVEMFHDHDERTLREQHPVHADQKRLIQTTKDAAAELERLFEADRKERQYEGS